MSTILVTGGLGFIGSHCCLNLLKNGQNILIIDSLINSSIEVKSKIEALVNEENLREKGLLLFREGDLRDKEWLKKIFEEFRVADNTISSVFHFAGLKSVEESTKLPIDYWDVNLNGTINLLNTMSENNCFNIIFSSSAMIYKQNLNTPFRENSELCPSNTYSNTKLAIERILEDLQKSSPSKWRIAILRYFNPVGAHESGLLGENPKKKAANLFPAIINSLKNDREELLIFGKDWPTKDGTCVRDFIHIMDLANAHVCAHKFIISQKPQIIYLNIGSGIGTSILHIIKTFEKVNNCSIKYKFFKRRAGDVPYIVADNSYAMKKINWKPIRSIEDICKDTWNWMKLNKDELNLK